MSTKPYMETKPQQQDYKTQAQRDLENAIANAKRIAKQHKELDVFISKQSCNMRLDETRAEKARLESIKKSLKDAVKQVHKLGGEFDIEKARIELSVA